jgi:flagellar hook-associated protein 3 FlgL
MSGTIGPTDYSMMNAVLDNSAQVRQKLDTLTQQVSSGLISNTYAGLGPGASVSLDLRPQMATLQTWQNNVDAVTGPMGVVQSTLSTVQSIASNFYSQLNNVNVMSGTDVDNIAASARDALKQVVGALDEQDGDVYVFAGQDSANPPIPDPADILTSGFYTQINAAVNNLAAAGAPATAAATLAIASSNAAGTSPFSAYLSQPAAVLQPQIPVVQVGLGDTRQVGMLASTNSNVASTGTSTTGSYMRDVLRALATIGSISSGQLNIPDFQDLVQDTRTSLSSAIDTMASDVGVLGNTQSSLTATQTQLSGTATALTAQVSSAEDADMAATLSRISLVQTQLQASYQLIASESSLSLAKILGTGA